MYPKLFCRGYKSKGKTQNATQTFITQRLRTDLGRSVGITMEEGEEGEGGERETCAGGYFKKEKFAGATYRKWYLISTALAFGITNEIFLLSVSIFRFTPFARFLFYF